MVPRTPAQTRELARTALGRRMPAESVPGVVGRAALSWYRDSRNAIRKLERQIDELGAPLDYEHWLRAHQADLPREAVRAAVERSANRRGVDIVIVGAPTDPGVVGTRESVAEQSWGLTVSSVVEPAHLGQHLATGDPDRLVMLLAPGDTLEHDTALLLADKMWQKPQLSLIAFDRDHRVGGEVEPRFVPEWSPELLISANYLGRGFAIRASVAAAALAAGPIEGDLRWGLLLRCGIATDRTARLDRVLLHEGSNTTSVPPLAELQAVLDDRGLDGTVEVDGSGDVRVRWNRTDPRPLTVVVPSRHNRPLLEVLLPSLRTTDHPDWELIIVDNSGETPDKAAWYDEHLAGLDAQVLWWTGEPFNYSAVNNAAVELSRGEVLVFLNDDTRIRSSEWLWELSSWAGDETLGTVGVRLIGGDGNIQHGGVVVGMSGFADHLFAGLPPRADTYLGSSTWYRNVSANTAACVAIRRELFDEIGGFDERFVLLGSDVVLGLDCELRGYRNVVTAAIEVDHLEATTRGGDVPVADMYTSYWRYQRLLRTGDPYYSKSLSLNSPRIELRRDTDRTPIERVGEAIGRHFVVFRQQASEDEALMLASMCSVPDDVLDGVRAAHEAVVGERPVSTVNWFIPDFDNPFYGGVATILRIADHLKRFHGVENRFICWAGPNEAWVRSGLRAIFPALGDSEIFFHNGSPTIGFDGIPDCDAAIATQWPTAYLLASYPGATRKFYLIQDFEPMFHAAGTMYALAEETYKLGLYGLCNTTSMERFYREDYEGTGMAFMPSVDTEVFHDRGRVERDPDDPISVFLYARPGHWRNCWEMVSLALDELKSTYGDRLRIMTAGAWARPEDLGRGIDHLGLLDYRSTGDLYRRADIGISLTVSPHPSYLPVELMACGAAVVAFDLPPGYWILRDGEDCVLARRTVPSLVAAVSKLIDDPARRRRIQARGREIVRRNHSDWDRSLARIYHFLSDPERFAGRGR
jgi:GT2 family glycosyltransferase/glycosyltransferase involved in cell wall biosynthesis